MQKYGIYLNITDAMVTKMADKIGLKTEKLPFWTKLKALGDRFFFKLDISTAKYQKSLYYVVCRGISHLLLKYLFGICLNSMIIFSVKPLNFTPK